MVKRYDAGEADLVWKYRLYKAKSNAVYCSMYLQSKLLVSLEVNNDVCRPV